MKRKIISTMLVLSMIILPCISIAVAVVAEAVPACSCENTAEDLSAHADNCDRKAFCRETSKKTAQEIYDLWGSLPADVREFVLTYLSWTNQTKLQELNELLKSFADDDTDTPNDLEQIDGCSCDTEYSYGSTEHDPDCDYHFKNLPVEEEYIIYITMTDDQRTAALSLLEDAKKAELEAYIASHPFAHTVSEDGISVTAVDVPVGATVTATVVDKEFTETLLPSITLANQSDVSLDIKIYRTDGTLWEPEDGHSVMVKISLPETVNGQRSDIVHILDSVSAIEKGLANGRVKFRDISSWFLDEDETGNILEVTPEMPDVYWQALTAAEKLGYEKQLAYEIITGTCVDDGYSVFYADSFSAYVSGSIGSGTYYINYQLDDATGQGTGLLNSSYKGYYLSEDKNGTRHNYYYNGFNNCQIPAGNTVNFIFVSGNVPVAGTITVNGTLNISLLSANQTFYKYRASGLKWVNKTASSYASSNANTIYRASSNIGALISVGSSGTLNLSGISADNPFIIDGKNVNASHAAIESSGKINLDYVTINSNHNYETGNGGAISIRGTSANTLDYVRINNCKGILGTAIYFTATGGSTTANNCNITGCETLGYDVGGTIRTTGATVSNITFNNCNVYKNKSGGHGGAFYWNAGGNALLTINNCNIYENTAGNRGGGIFCESVMKILGNTKIYSNTAGKGGGGICVQSYGGGTENMNGSDISLSSSISIYNNSTTADGGGIFMDVYNTDDLVSNAIFKIQLNGAKIYGNSALSGGGIYIKRNSNAASYQCSVDLNYGEFKDNTATSGNGGGVYTENVNVAIGNTSGTAMTISGNKAHNGSGGAVYSTGSMGSCTITNGTLTTNSASSGGAIAINNGVVIVTGGTFNSNTATNYGGAIYSTGASGSCTISNGTLTLNSAKYGGAIAVSNGNITANGGSVNSNTASLFGGAIYTTGTSASVTVSGNGSISSNTAANGGGIYATAGADVNVTGGIISYNTAKGSPSVTTAYNDAASSGVGGGIYVGNGTSTNSSSITLSGSSVGLYGNTADFAAADAYASGTYTLVTLPAVKNMNLTGYSGSATGWYEDYATSDTGYAHGLQNGSAGERYTKARTTYEVTSASNVTKYTAITLGTAKQGYGNLTIKKSGADVDQSQVFIFEITGNNLSMIVSVVGTDSITIYELPDGTYTVTEITSWSWRYTPADASMDTTISGTNVNPILTFSNTLTNNDWLSAADNMINVKG